MDSFLPASKKTLSSLSSYRKIRVVLGNPTCDLDSAVCAVVKGLSEYLDERKSDREDTGVIPVLNIPEKEFRVKTEVVYYFRRHGIPSDLLTFRDQIDLLSLSREKKLEIILVDHHNLKEEDAPLVDSVVEIVDHRPRDPSWPWPGRAVSLEIVGSCASLVARSLLRKHPEILDNRLCSLLRGPILIDTCNFSAEAARATPLDFEVTEALERAGKLEESRKEDFEAILAAKTDVSGLTADDLLIRDLKVADGIPIVGLPMLVQTFVKTENVPEAIRGFARSRESRAVVLIGLDASSGKVARDVAVFSLEGDSLGNKIVRELTSSRQPDLELSKVHSVRKEGCELTVYRQGNLRVTRKQILPIVQKSARSLS